MFFVPCGPENKRETDSPEPRLINPQNRGFSSQKRLPKLRTTFDIFKASKAADERHGLT